jgi:hypothetical protein
MAVPIKTGATPAQRVLGRAASIHTPILEGAVGEFMSLQETTFHGRGYSTMAIPREEALVGQIRSPNIEPVSS